MDDAIRFHNHQSAGHLRELVNGLLELQPAQEGGAAARTRFTINHLQCTAEHVRELHLVELGSPPPAPRPAAAAVSSASPITVLGESHTALLRAAQDQGQRILALWSPEAFEAGRRLDLEAMAALAAALDALLLTLDALLEVTRALHHALDPLDALAEAEEIDRATPRFTEERADAATLSRCPRCDAPLGEDDRVMWGGGTYCEACRSAWLVPEVG